MRQLNLFEEDYKKDNIFLNVSNHIESWSNLFSEELIKSIYNYNSFINNLRETVTIFPNEYETFRVFRETAIENIKVVIVGQDPYYNGNANGRAFACKNRMSPSLRAILNSIMSDCSPRLNIKNDKEFISLDHLVKQGVFLLNSSLNVIKNRPNSLNADFNKFLMKEFISLINSEKENVVFLLWGSSAQSISDLIDINKHHILKAEHPAKSSYNNRKWNHRKCFRITNDILISKNQNPIKWW